jgi:hypothetical protein
MVVLGGALLWGACSKEPAPQAAPAAQPEQAPKPAEEAAAEPESEEAPSAKPQAAAPAQAEEDATPREFKEGQSRSEVMKLFGNCAERKAFIPPGPKSLYVEVYQPKNTELCKKRLGERRFTIRGGKLQQITPGMIPELRPPPKPSPNDSFKPAENL